MRAATHEVGNCVLRRAAVVVASQRAVYAAKRAMPQHTAVRAVAVLISFGVGSIAAMAQTPESQPRIKRLSPEHIESILKFMPPEVQDAERRLLESKGRLEFIETLMAEKRPHWTKATVLRKIPHVFPSSDPAQILGMLERAKLSYRVELAIIKLCDEGNGLSDLAHYVNAAKIDERDVMSWAEFPNDSKLPLSASVADREAAQKLDQEQYLRWIGQDR
jgi:hypothetical protein